MSVRTLGVAAALTLALVVPSASQSASGRQAAALATLARAEAVFQGSPRRPTRDATPALRDLAFVMGDLRPAARRRAAALLDRPDDPGGSRGGEVRYRVPSVYFCTAHFCVHYVESTNDAPAPRDDNGNGIPNQVETTASVLESIWSKDVDEWGFRPPKTDLALANHGPDGRFDVYLADIVDQGVLGFCAPERPLNYAYRDVPGYCVLDNDYSPAQIGAPGLAGTRELEITAVHEFFHAIQFGYDAGEDIWFLEGTATWIEDEAYPAVRAAYNRFPYSALRQPQVPVDNASATAPYQYGSWVFWRFLEELLAPRSTRFDPGVIRRVWEWADASPGAPDRYSLEAVEATLAERQMSFRSAFLTFAVANLVPSGFYREGKTWPSAPLTATFTLGSSRTDVKRRRLVLDHLTSRYVAFVPRKGTRARLSLSLDLPPGLSSPAAAAVVFRRSGRQVRTISLSAAGDARVVVPFGSGAVRRVVLVLTNASTRFSCFRFSVFSCNGSPVDDKRPFLYSARLLR